MSFTGNELWSYQDSLMASAYLMCRNKADADDLLQRTYERCLVKQDQYEGDNLGGWLYRIMQRIFLQDKRDCQRDRRYFRDGIFQDHTGPNQELRAFSNEVLALIDAMPSPTRRTVISLYAEGYTNKEIAARLGVPIGTVQSNFSRAREALTKCI